MPKTATQALQILQDPCRGPIDGCLGTQAENGGLSRRAVARTLQLSQVLVTHQDTFRRSTRRPWLRAPSFGWARIRRPPACFERWLRPTLLPAGNMTGALDRLVDALEIPARERQRRMAEARQEAAAAVARTQTAELGLTTILEAAYPALLQQIPDPPIVFWHDGQSTCSAVQPSPS